MNDIYTGNVSSMGTYFNAGLAGAAVGMIGAAAGAIGGMVVGALGLGTVGTAVVSAFSGFTSAYYSTCMAETIMNGSFNHDQAMRNAGLAGLGSAFSAAAMPFANTPILKALINTISSSPLLIDNGLSQEQNQMESILSGAGSTLIQGYVLEKLLKSGIKGGLGGNGGLMGPALQNMVSKMSVYKMSWTNTGNLMTTNGSVLGNGTDFSVTEEAIDVAKVNAAATQMTLFNQLTGSLIAIETITNHLNKEEAARQQKVLDQARERARELAKAEEKYISANIKSRAEALAAVEAMMREYGLTQSQYEAIRDALIAQNVISATAGQAYAGAWEDLLYGDLAEYGVGYAPVLGNIYWAMSKEQRAALRARRKELMAEINSMKNPPPDKKPDKDQKPLKKPSREKFDKYLDDLEKRTGYKFTEEQRQKLYEALDNENFYKLSPEQNAAWRKNFNNQKDQLILEWEKHTGQKWPTYQKWVMTKKGLRLFTFKYDAHHIFENHFTGAAEWWNIIPARPDIHTGVNGIHLGDSLADNLFNDN